jgi:hypothetical protein
LYITLGYQEVLRKIPRCQTLDLEEAAEHLADPEPGNATFPFGVRILDPEPGSDGAASDAEAGPAPKKRKGITVKHTVKMQKYGAKSAPAFIKTFFKENWPLPSELNNKSWRDALADLEAGALAASTWKKYCSVLKKFKSFTEESGLPQNLDFSEKMLMSFAVWCRSKKLGSGTIRSYIASLRTVACILGFKVSRKNSKALNLILRGAENLETLSVKNSKKCDPFVFEVLEAVRKSLKHKRWRPESKTVVWAACCTGYFGAFRAGEILAKSENFFDKFSDLLWENVVFFKNGVQLKLKAPKVPVPGGEFVDLFNVPDPRFCPRTALEKLKAVQKKHGVYAAGLPVFRFASGKNLTVAGLSHLIKVLTVGTKFQNQFLTARSIRSGLPTDMEGRPDLLQDELIKNWGRWRSDSYQTYMKNDRAQRRWIFGKICDTLNLK